MLTRAGILVVLVACSSREPTSHPTQNGSCPSNAGVQAGCGVTPHDDCLTDVDCGADAVCSCQAPIPAGEACPSGVPLVAGNVCIAADCRLDADCASGACQTEYICGATTGLFCRTANDACVPTDPSTSYSGNGCVFRNGRWQLEQVACPG
jgi:hypothetical protein